MMKPSENNKKNGLRLAKSQVDKTHVPVKTMTTEEINAKSDAVLNIITGQL